VLDLKLFLPLMKGEKEMNKFGQFFLAIATVLFTGAFFWRKRRKIFKRLLPASIAAWTGRSSPQPDAH